MRKSEQESETAEQYEVRWRLDKDADKEKGRGEVDSGVRNSDGDGTVGLLSSGEGSVYLFHEALPVSLPLPLSATLALVKLPSALPHAFQPERHLSISTLHWVRYHPALDLGPWRVSGCSVWGC